MGLNRKFAESNRTMTAAWIGLNGDVTPDAGDPVILGKLPGVCLAPPDAAGLSVAQLDGIFDLPVKAENGAIAVGAILYFDQDDAVTSLNDDATGPNARFGYALEAIGNGLTDTINVKVGY